MQRVIMLLLIRIRFFIIMKSSTHQDNKVMRQDYYFHKSRIIIMKMWRSSGRVLAVESVY